jgi:hypothetical protein
LENIAYGDSIGQDADQVFSLNRRGLHDMFYSVVKNRLGPEIGGERGIHVRFDANVGILRETGGDDEEDDGDE